MKEHVLSLNDFSMPKVYSDDGAMYVCIIRLLMLDKGKFQSHPDMGVGLRTRFRFTVGPETLENLRNDITTQITTFLPSLILSSVKLMLSADNILHIEIETTKGIYALSYDSKVEELNVDKSVYTLNNLISN